MAAAPDSVPRTSEIGIDLSVLAFTLGISVLAVFLFALAPMAQVRRTESGRLAAERKPAGNRRQAAIFCARLWSSLKSLSPLVLVVGSGLMLRAFWKLRNVELSFDPQGVLLLQRRSSGERIQRSRPAAIFSIALEEKLSRSAGREVRLDGH